MLNFIDSLDQERSNARLWEPITPQVDAPIFHSGYLFKLSKKRDGSRQLEIRYFALHGDLLVYKKNKDSDKVSGAMNVNLAKVEITSSSSIQSEELSAELGYGLKISRGSKYSMLFAKSRDELNAWMAALSKVAVRADFHDRFEVVEMIGEGTFAQVFKIRTVNTGRCFAMKAFSKASVLANPVGIAALKKEIQTLRSISDLKIGSRLLEVHETGDCIGLVMDLIEGGTLLDLIRSDLQLSQQSIANVARGILQNLNDLSTLGIFHRDLKPSNVMLRKTSMITPEDVVIIDFGLSASADDREHLFKRCGTPGYIAPELIAAKVDQEGGFSVPSKADVYSAGVLIYYLITRQPLFDRTGLDINTILKANLRSKIEFPDDVFGNKNRHLQDLLANLLHPDPEVRSTVEQALEHPYFKPFREKGLLKNDILFGADENACQPIVMPAKEFMIKRNYIPRNSRLELGPKRPSQKLHLQVVIPPIGPQIHLSICRNPPHPATLGDEEQLLSPVTSQSNDLSKSNSLAATCSGSARLSAGPNKILFSKRLLSRNIVSQGRPEKGICPSTR